MKHRLFPTIIALFAANFASPLARADWILTTRGLAALACTHQDVGRLVQASQTDSPNLTAITDGAGVDGSCPIAPGFPLSGAPTSASYQAHAAFNDVSGSVQALNSGFGTAAANYTDDVTLHPPAGFTDSTVTFGMLAFYNLQVDVSGEGGSASADLFFHVLGLDFVQGVDAFTSGNGSFSGLLQTPQFTVNVAVDGTFTTEFQLAGNAVAGAGIGSASASFSDPVTFILPPGWTYTLASQSAVSAVPEPSSLLLSATAVLIGLGRLIWRRIRVP